MKATLIKTAVAAAITLAAAPAFATCSASNTADCTSTTNTTVNFGSSYQLDPDHSGIYLQNNTGTNTAVSTLQHVEMKNDGKIDVNTAAIGNSLQISLSNQVASDLNLVHVNQTNKGDQTAVTDLGTWGNKVGEVSLNTVAVGNNFSLSTDKAAVSLADLSVNQCNTGDITAVTKFYRDPTALNVSTSAIGNAVSITLK